MADVPNRGGGILLGSAVLDATQSQPQRLRPAVTIDLINMCANFSGSLANHTTGWLRSPDLGDGACLLFFAACYMLGGLVMSFVKIPGGAEVPLAPPQSQAS